MSSSRYKPRFLIATNLHPQHYFMNQRYPGIVKALDEYETSFIDIFDFYGNPDKAQQLEDLCSDAGKLTSYFDKADLLEINEHFLNLILSYDWDILCLLTVSHYGQFILPETIRRLRQKGKLVVGFLGDDEYNFERHKFWLFLFDAVVAYTEKEVNRYKKWNPYTYLLPVGAVVPDSTLAANKDIDVIFVGKPYGTRPDILDKLRRKGFNLVIYGSRKWASYLSLKDSYRGFLKSEDYWKELSRAKIVLALMEDYEGKPHINGKVFEAAAVGAMSIATYYEPFKTTYGLTPGQEIVFYHDAEDLVAKLKYYLDHDNEREAIAARLKERILQEFTYDKLYASLFTQLVNQWRNNSSDSIWTKCPPYENFTVLCKVENEQEYNQAQADWKQYPNLDIVYLSSTSLVSHPEVISPYVFLEQIKTGYRNLNELVLMAHPGVEYDDAVFALSVAYREAGFFENGVYYDSLVNGKRLAKKYFFDLCSVVWTRETFLANAESIFGSKNSSRVALNVTPETLGSMTHRIPFMKFLRNESNRIMEYLYRKSENYDLTHVPIRVNNILDNSLANRLKFYSVPITLFRKFKSALVKLGMG